MIDKNGENEYSFNTTVNLIDIYSQEELKNLKSVFPTIYSLLLPNIKNNSAKTSPAKINNDSKTFINKFKLCQLILEKIKFHFMEEKDIIIVKSINFIFKEINNLLNIISKYKVQTKLTKNRNNLPKANEIKIIKIQRNNDPLSNKNTNNFTIDSKAMIENMIKRRINRSSQFSFGNISSINYSNFSKQLIENDNNNNDGYERQRKKINSKTSSIINNFITITSTNNNNNKNKKNYISKHISMKNNKNTLSLRKNNSANKDNVRSSIVFPQTNNVDNFYIVKSETYNRLKSFAHSKKTSFNNFKTGIKMNKNKNYTFYSSKNNNNKNLKNKLKQKNIFNEKLNNCRQKQRKNSFEVSETLTNTYNKEKITGNIKEVQIPNKSSINKNTLNLNDIISMKLISSSLIENKDFNIFEYEESIGKANTLTSIGYYIFNKFQFNTLQINQEKFENWSKKIAKGYHRENPFHSDLHAADVTQAALVYYKIGKMNDICKFDKTSLCSLFFSCMCHDFRHPGFTNNFLKETKNILAERYNDSSILENMHISETFKLINHDKDCDIFSGVDPEIYKKIRREMILCVLSTDMAYHPKHIEFMKSIINNKNPENFDTHDGYLRLVTHSADISNSTRPFKIYLKWAKLVVEEFCLQGDKEKKLGLPVNCNREESFCLNQLSFLEKTIEPFVNLYVKIFPKLGFVKENLENNKKQLKNNKEGAKIKIKKEVK